MRTQTRSPRPRGQRDEAYLIRLGRWAGLGAAAVLVLLVVVADRLEVAAATEVDSGLAGVFRFREHGTGVTIWGTVLLIGFLPCVAMLFANWVSVGRNEQMLRVAAVLIRVVLLAAVVFMFFFTELPQLEAKSLTWRTVVYPSLTMVMPVTYWLRGSRGPYPWFVDANWAFVFMFDIVSNDLHWYGTWYYWDAFVHLANSVPFFGVLLLLLLAIERRTAVRVPFGVVAWFALAVFATLHLFWETYEFLADEVAGTELQPGGMREATIDNVTGLLGAVLTVGLVTWWRDRGLLDRLLEPLADYLDMAVHRRRS